MAFLHVHVPTIALTYGDIDVEGSSGKIRSPGIVVMEKDHEGTNWELSRSPRDEIIYSLKGRKRRSRWR